MASTLELKPNGIRNGVWEATVLQTDNGVPQIEVLHLDRPVASTKLAATDDAAVWSLSMPIPEEAIADGVQTFLVVDTNVQEKIGDFTLIAGEALGDDLRAEVELLRAELDMLKRAFRRHCVETA